MEYIELSLEDVEKKSKELYEMILKDKFDFELVIFIAKGSFPIAKKLSKDSNVPLLEISATRKGGGVKKILKPFLKIVPKRLLIYLRRKEMKSTYHEKNCERNISFSVSKYKKYLKCNKILLIDDSIDSGYSIIEVKKALENYFNAADIRVAVFNTMKKSIIRPDFTLYEDTMICGPWSNDSKFYSTFLTEYKKWKKEYDR